MRLGRWLLIAIASLALSAAPLPQAKGGAVKKAETKTAQKSGKPAAKPGGMVDINSATEQELRQLPGIGEAYASKIIQNRPYRGKNDLVRKKVIPEATYDKVKDRIVATQKK